MPEHQISMELDLNKCFGCQTCTMACKKLWTDGDGMDYMYWNNVETRPGQGYPRNWDKIGGGFENGQLRPSEIPSKEDYGQTFEYNSAQRLFQGGFEAMPNDEVRNTPNWDEDVGAMMLGENYYFYLPRLCNHCTNPACLEACPRKAIYKRAEDGIVLVDQIRSPNMKTCCRFRGCGKHETPQHSWDKAPPCPGEQSSPLVAGCSASERHLRRFAELCENVPGTLQELRSLYIDLFEAGLPQPRCPLLESAWLLNRPAGDVVLENKLFYQNFGLEIHSQAAPDHLPTQLEFLAWLDHCLAAGNPDAASLERARAEFLERHLAHWIRPLANLARNADGDCYADLLDALSLEIESALA